MIFFSAALRGHGPASISVNYIICAEPSLYRMKPIQWVFIVTALTLVFVAFAINPLQAAIDEAIKSNAQLQAQQLASAINIVSSAPDGTSYIFQMPKGKCNVIITDGFVKMTITPVVGTDLSYIVSLIKTPVKITNGLFDCKGNRNLLMKKTGGTLTITTN